MTIERGLSKEKCAEWKPSGEKEKKELLTSENFDICYDEGVKEILEQGDEKKFDEIKEFVDRTLGSKWEMGEEKVKIHLFSDREKYFQFLDKNFPDVPKDPAVFHKETNSVADHTQILKEEHVGGLLALQKEKITPEKIKGISRANMFSSVGHELAHLHPFYGGVGNEGSENKWEQEHVCLFIGEKIRREFGNKYFFKYQFEKAQKELKQLEDKGERFSWEKTERDWDNWTTHERFVYFWLEKRYGLEKLQNLWQKMFKEKETLTKSLKEVYGTEIEQLEQRFQQDTINAKDYSEICELGTIKKNTEV